MTTYEIHAREKKAAAIVAVLVKTGITAAEAVGASAEDWRLAAKAAKVNAPSEATVKIVVETMRDRERAA